jgi:hypothetical protein
MPNRCVECDHLLVDDDAEYLVNGKSYCEDCYRMFRSAGDEYLKFELPSLHKNDNRDQKTHKT